MSSKVDVALVLKSWDATGQKGKREQGGAADLPALWTSSGQNAEDAPDLVAEGLGIAVAGAIVGQCLAVEDAGGHVLTAGVNLLIPTYNGARISSALNQLLSPVRTGPPKRCEAIAEIEREHNRKALELAKTDYRLYRQSNVLPKREYLNELARKVGRLEQGSNPLMLLENPLPGQLTAAVGNSPTLRWLVTYDDFGFSGLIAKARNVRGMLDLDLLIRSWHQQAFSAAYLEGVHPKTIPSPLVWAIIVALPETVANFLLSPDPLVAGLASCCWMIDGGRESSGSPVVSHWTPVIARLAKHSGCPAEDVIRMSKGGADLLFRFQDKAELAVRQMPVESVGFVNQLPRLISKISQNLQLAVDEPPAQIMQPQMERAISRVEFSLKQRHDFMRTWREILVGRDIRQFCELVLEKVTALGPIGTRDLCRSCDARLERVSAALKHLLQAEQILKQPDGRFEIPARWLSRLRIETCW
jgi:hypothetical protein